METTIYSIASYAASMSTRGRMGIKNITFGSNPKFQPNRHVAGVEPAQNAIELDVVRDRFRENAHLAAVLVTACAAANPLVADPAKGLRSLATWDANGDGKIDQFDPIYRQLKVWQDANLDGDNTQEAIFNTAAGPQTVTVQDEAIVNGRNTLELNSLADWGITAIDYANNRYEFDSGLRNTGQGSGQISYQSIKTVTLEASNEGTRYTPVGALSIDRNTINPIAIRPIPIGARGQIGTQDTPEAVLSENSEPTYVTRHCARPARRPLRVEYHTSRAAHRPCAVASGWVGEVELSIGYLGKLDIYYKIDSTWRRIYAGEMSKRLKKLAKIHATEAANEINWRKSA